MIKRILLVFWIVFWGVSFADELEIERKELQGLFITERASSQQEKGEWQFRGDFEYRRDNEIELKQYRVPIELEYGIVDWLELDLAIPYVWQEEEGEDTDSIGNLNAGVTFLVVRGNEEIPYVSVGFEVAFPTVQEDQDIADEEEQYTYEGFINITKSFEYLVIDLNFAYSQSRNGEVEEELEYNIGVDFLIDRILGKDHLIGWHWITEFNGESNLSEDVNAFYLTPGIKYVTKAGLELGLGAPIGLVDEADDYRIIGSLTYEWGG